MERGQRIDPEMLAEHRPFLESLARSLVLDPNAADDLVQETLLAALENPPRSSVRGFLGRVVRNLAYRSLRTRERRRRREHRAARPDAQPGTDELFAKAVAVKGVVDALVDLEEPYRTVLLLRYFDDLPPAGIAARLDRNPATVRSQLRRGLERMRERLDERHGGDRRAWCLPLLPLAFAKGTAAATTAAVAGGVAVMTLKQKLAIAAALILGIGTTGYFARTTWRGDEASRARASRTTADASRLEHGPDAAARASREERDRPTCVAEIRVKNRRGAPVAGAEVAVVGIEPAYPIRVPVSNEERRWRAAAQSRARGAPAASVRTNADGVAFIRTLPAGRWDVRVRHGDYATVAVHWQGVGREGAPPLHVVLGPARTLEGTVRSAAGEIVSGAIVLVGHPAEYRGDASMSWSRRTVADDLGRYRFSDLPDRAFSVSAAPPGAIARLLAIVGTPGPERFDVTLPDGGAIEGRVTGDGAPLAGVEVLLTSIDGSHAHAVTDAEGRYRMEFVAEGRLAQAAVRKPGWALSSVRDLVQAVQIDRALVARLDLELVRAATIRGRITNALGPVAGAGVGTTFRRTDGEIDSASTMTGADGRYELRDLPPGQHGMAFHAEGHARIELSPRWFEFLPGTPDQYDLATGEVLTVDRALDVGTATIAGRVVDANGAPLAGATVWMSEAAARAWTDERGRFELRPPPDSAPEPVRVRLEGYVEPNPAPVLAAPHSDLEIRLAPAPVYRGTVRGPDGEIVPGAFLHWAGVNRPDRPLDVNWWTGREQTIEMDGSFELGTLGSFPQTLRAEAPGYAPSEPIVREDGSPTDLRLALRPLARIEGRVTAAGKPVPGAHVRVRAGKGAPLVQPGSRPRPGEAIVAVTDARGRFVAASPPGDFYVAVSTPGFGDAVVRASAPGALVEIELEPTQRIAGTVRLADGRPVAGASVSIHPSEPERRRMGQSYPSCKTNAEGAFHFEELDPGRYTISVRPGSETNVQAVAAFEVEAGTTDVRIEAVSGHEVAGRVVDEDGEGVPALWLEMMSPDASYSGSETTDGEGRFRFLGTPAGEFTLSLQIQQRYRTVIERTGVRAGTTDLRLVWKDGLDLPPASRARAIAGIVLGSDGEPVHGARVLASSRSGERTPRKICHSDPDGWFLFRNLDPGAYRLEAYLKDGSQRAESEGETGRLDLKVRLRDVPLLRGVVRDANGRPARQVRIELWQRTRLQSVRPEHDGRFSIPGLEAGQEYAVLVRGAEYAGQIVPGVRVGSGELEITVEPGLDASGVLLRADGTPAAGVVVEFEFADDRRLRMVVQTDRQGRFVVRGLRAGRYVASARIGPEPTPCGEVVAGANDVKLIAK